LRAVSDAAPTPDRQEPACRHGFVNAFDVHGRYSVPDAVLLALQAGADTALWITTDQVPAVLDRLEQAVNTGELSKDRVTEALHRVALGKGPHPNSPR
jgi:hypothetical protein